jgi:hypothetical protein
LRIAPIAIAVDGLLVKARGVFEHDIGLEPGLQAITGPHRQLRLDVIAVAVALGAATGQRDIGVEEGKGGGPGFEIDATDIMDECSRTTDRLVPAQPYRRSRHLVGAGARLAQIVVGLELDSRAALEVEAQTPFGIRRGRIELALIGIEDALGRAGETEGVADPVGQPWSRKIRDLAEKLDPQFVMPFCGFLCGVSNLQFT